tara:strand:+ start:436 stop:1542 length:1107 start_codon:yes stop_codon:yes gene_type:complete
MNIFDLKNVIFGTLKSPMTYLNDRFPDKDANPDSTSVYNNSVYFYSGDNDWYTPTDNVVLKESNINGFVSKDHSCSFEVSKDWLGGTMEQLKICAKMVYEDQLNPYICNQHATFESFWNRCGKPTSKINVTEYAYSRRGHQKQFINVYDNIGKEMTGKMIIASKSSVKMALRWVFTVSGADPDSIRYGFRPYISIGIRVIQMGETPFMVVSPWSWSSLSVDTMSFPMYKSFLVKTPALKIISAFGPQFKVDLSAKAEFKKAMDEFHRLMGVEAWDGTIQLNTSKSVRVGAFVIARISPTENNTDILWQTQKFLLMNPRNTPAQIAPSQKEKVPEKVGMKRDADNTDSSSVSKTKRQCILNDTDGHNST